MSVLTFLLERKILSKIALVGFLLTLPLSVRKVFLLFSPAGDGIFNEFTDVSLYLSDLALLTILFFILLENKNSILSILKWKELFHVEQSRSGDQELENVPRGTFLDIWKAMKEKCSTWNITVVLTVSPLPFLVWTAISIFWSESQTLAFYATIKLSECYFLYAGIIFLNVPRGTIPTTHVQSANCSTWNNSNHACPECQLFHVEQFWNDKSQISNVPRGTFESILFRVLYKCSTWNIYDLIFKTLIFSGFIQAVISISQFISQSSLGMTFLKESQFVPEQAGIAKIIYLDTAFIRPYGLFPHPNILAAFLGITILMTIGYRLVFGKQLFHVEQLRNHYMMLPNVPRGTIGNIMYPILMKCSTWNISKCAQSITKKMFHVEHFGLLYGLVLEIELFGFLLTFSKSAFIGLFLAILYLLYRLFHVEQFKNSQSQSSIVPRGTIFSRLSLILKKCSTWNIYGMDGKNIKKMFHVEQLFVIIGTSLALVSGAIFLKGLNWYYFFQQPLNERFYLYKSFFSIFDQYPWLGVGVGQLVFTLQNFFVEKLNIWQFQPIHNLYLLITAELGLIGLILFLFFISMIVIVPRGTFGKIFSWFVRKCSTWNILNEVSDPGKEMFHVEHFVKKRVFKMKGVFFESLLIFILITGLFDHYYWDIQQGQLLFWLVLGLLASQRVLRSVDK